MAVVVVNSEGVSVLRPGQPAWRAMPSKEGRRYIAGAAEARRVLGKGRGLLNEQHPFCGDTKGEHTWMLTYHRPLASLFRKTHLAHCVLCDLTVPVGDDEQYARMVVYGRPGHGRTMAG